MPCRRPQACCGSTSRSPSECVCVSMNPGETVSPLASITRLAATCERSPMHVNAFTANANVGPIGRHLRPVDDLAAADYYVKHRFAPHSNCATSVPPYVPDTADPRYRKMRTIPSCRDPGLNRMNNTQIAEVFENIAGLLEIKGERRFVVVSYQRAARTIDHLPTELEQMVREEEDLTQIPGIGKAIAGKITQLATEGKMDFYEKLRGEFPDGILDVMRVPGVGPKSAKRLWDELDVTTVEALEAVASDGRLAALPQAWGRRRPKTSSRRSRPRARRATVFPLPAPCQQPSASSPLSRNAVRASSVSSRRGVCAGSRRPSATSTSCVPLRIPNTFSTRS